MWKLLPIALLFLAPAATAQTKLPPAPAPQPIIGSAKAPMPPREADYIRIVDHARRQYLSARSNDARKGARIAMQSAVHNFMGLAHSAENWVGVFTSRVAPDRMPQVIMIRAIHSLAPTRCSTRLLGTSNRM